MREKTGNLGAGCWGWGLPRYLPALAVFPRNRACRPPARPLNILKTSDQAKPGQTRGTLKTRAKQWARHLVTIDDCIRLEQTDRHCSGHWGLDSRRPTYAIVNSKQGQPRLIWCLGASVPESNSGSRCRGYPCHLPSARCIYYEIWYVCAWCCIEWQLCSAHLFF